MNSVSEQCTAKSKTSGKRCRNKAVPGKHVCRIHGGAPGSGGQPGNQNARKHGVYAQILYKTMSDEDKSLFESVSATDDLDLEIELIRYKLAQLTEIIESNRDNQEYVYPTRAIEDLTDLLRKMVKDKKDREFRSLEKNDSDNGSLDELTAVMARGPK